MITSPRDSKQHRDRSPGRRPQKRPYLDRDHPERDDDERYRAAHPVRDMDRDRGSKMPRRGGGMPSGRWNGRGAMEGSTGGRRLSGEASRVAPQQLQPQPQATPPVVAGSLPNQQPPIFGMPPMPPAGAFPPWMPPPNPNDPMTAFLAAQAAAAWGFTAGVPGSKPGEKKIVKKVRERCKDYDEKGFCMKGDMCPYEHGVDLIIAPSQQTKAEGAFYTATPLHQPQQLIGCAEYDPNDSMLPSISHSDKGSRGGRGGSYRGRGNRGSMRGGRGGRAEFSATGPSFDRSNTKLVVENIPDDKLTDATIKQFFSTFGTVDNVEIHQQKNLAILTFTTWDMAKAAYDSPAPIFDNRFVKVFWCKLPGADESGSPATTHGFGGPRRFSAPRYEDEAMEEKEKIDIEEVKKKQEELQKAHEEKMVKKKAHEDAAKELQKRQEELMKLQAEEKRKLMEKLAKKHASTASSGSPTTPGSATPSSTNGAKKSKAEDTTAILKAQLEALQAEALALGIDQNAQEDMFDLEGFRGEGFRGRGRGRGGYVPRGRGGYIPRAHGFSSTFRGRGAYVPRGRGYTPAYTPLRLDNRTKRVSVTIPDMQGDKEEEIRHHLIVCSLSLYNESSYRLLILWPRTMGLNSRPVILTLTRRTLAFSPSRTGGMPKRYGIITS